MLGDLGAESSLIKLSVAVKLGLQIRPTDQADGKTRLATRGEVHVTFTRGDVTLPIEAIVLEDLFCNVIGGAPFLEQNQIILDMGSTVIL